MAARIIDGNVLAAQVKQEVAQQVAQLAEQGIAVRLAVILVGSDPASQVYVRSKARDCEQVGIVSDTYTLPAETTQKQLLELVGALGADSAVNGILVQLPLPAHIDKTAVIEAIPPEKDVDCFTPHNTGLLFAGRQMYEPCTPGGIIEMLRREGIPTAGADCVIIGRSDIVGKPLALMMTAFNATVTLCHSKTADLSEKAKKADILIAAMGKPRFVTANMIKPGAAVIDVGINRLEDGTLCGDVDFDAARDVAGAITPVPGGVGLMTRAVLLKNTVAAAEHQRKNS